MKTLTLAALVSASFIQTSEAREICANCYWKKSDCPSITPENVVEMELTNKNEGIAVNNQGPFKKFACDNGSETLGVEWTNGKCESNGGLSGISDDEFPELYNNPACEFGK